MSEDVIVKHRELSPWELHPPGSSRRQRGPDDFDEKAYKVRVVVATFDWNVYWGIMQCEKFSITRTINLWWDYVFNEPFPSEGGRLYDLYNMIRDQVVDISYKQLRVVPKDSDYAAPSLLSDKNKRWKTAREQRINKHPYSWEDSMGKLLLKKPASAVAPAAQTVDKKAKSAESGDVSERKTKKRKARDAVVKLMLERKFTDAELIEKIKKDIGYEYNPQRINLTRFRLNAGEYAEFGFDKPDQAVTEIGGTPKVAKPKSEKPKAVAPTPAPAVAPVAVKKLLLKKK